MAVLSIQSGLEYLNIIRNLFFKNKLMFAHIDLFVIIITIKI